MEQDKHADNLSEQLRELARLERKRLFHARLVSVFCVVLLVAVALAALTYGTRLQKLLSDAEEITTELHTLAVDADAMVTSIDKVVVDNTAAVTEAIEKLNSVDFTRLNDAINGLADAITPLARIGQLFS